MYGENLDRNNPRANSQTIHERINKLTNLDACGFKAHDVNVRWFSDLGAPCVSSFPDLGQVLAPIFFDMVGFL